MAALRIHDARYLHVLEFFLVLVVNGFQIITCRFLHVGMLAGSRRAPAKHLPPELLVLRLSIFVARRAQGSNLSPGPESGP